MQNNNEKFIEESQRKAKEELQLKLKSFKTKEERGGFLLSMLRTTEASLTFENVQEIFILDDSQILSLSKQDKATIIPLFFKIAPPEQQSWLGREITNYAWKKKH